MCSSSRRTDERSGSPPVKADVTLNQGRRPLYVQYGAGACSPSEWKNFDCSPSLRAARLPIVGRFYNSPFPNTVIYGDIVRGLPVQDGSVRGAYASHVLEHLSRTDCMRALRNTIRMLEPGGRFRLIVPDLEARAIAYAQAASTGDPNAAHNFMRGTHLGLEGERRSIYDRLRHTFGNSRHLWMWDRASMASALADVGFTGIRQCKFGDSGDPMFELVEDGARYEDAALNISECALEAIRSRS